MVTMTLMFPLNTRLRIPSYYPEAFFLTYRLLKIAITIKIIDPNTDVWKVQLDLIKNSFKDRVRKS
jgi:hypothetical protein